MDTITVSDIDAEQGMEVEFTRMEDVVTKMNVKWYMTYAPGAEQYAAGQEALPQYMILRHNVAHYGLLEKDYEWYIFNQPDIILKMATFWLNRLSNTWKRLKFRTYLNHLNLEALDCVNFNAPGYVASGPVSVIVERAEYDSANNCIDIECATPVKAGALAADPYYWPAALSPTVNVSVASGHCRGQRGRGRHRTAGHGGAAGGQHGWDYADGQRICGRSQHRFPWPKRLGRPDAWRRGLFRTAASPREFVQHGTSDEPGGQRPAGGYPALRNASRGPDGDLPGPRHAGGDRPDADEGDGFQGRHAELWHLAAGLRTGAKRGLQIDAGKAQVQDSTGAAVR